MSKPFIVCLEFCFVLFFFVVVVVNTESACSIFVVDTVDKGSIYCLPG